MKRGRIQGAGASFFTYTRSERIADALVHGVGLAFGLGALIALVSLALGSGDLLLWVCLGIYAAGLLAMLGFSALYNLTRDVFWKGWFRRFDHAAIFVMIAGTYTPFVLVSIGGVLGVSLFIFVWAVAAAGVVLKLVFPTRFERSSTIAYLLLGWTIVVALDPLFAAVSFAGVALLAAGGVLYTIGTAFHVCTRLPYHNAIWHLFVLAAASCHFAAIVHEVAQG